MLGYMYMRRESEPGRRPMLLCRLIQVVQRINNASLAAAVMGISRLKTNSKKKVMNQKETRENYAITISMYSINKDIGKYCSR